MQYSFVSDFMTYLKIIKFYAKEKIVSPMQESIREFYTQFYDNNLNFWEIRDNNFKIEKQNK